MESFTNIIGRDIIRILLPYLPLFDLVNLAAVSRYDMCTVTEYLRYFYLKNRSVISQSKINNTDHFCLLRNNIVVNYINALYNFRCVCGVISLHIRKGKCISCKRCYDCHELSTYLCRVFTPDRYIFVCYSCLANRCNNGNRGCFNF